MCRGKEFRVGKKKNKLEGKEEQKQEVLRRESVCERERERKREKEREI